MFAVITKLFLNIMFLQMVTFTAAKPSVLALVCREAFITVYLLNIHELSMYQEFIFYKNYTYDLCLNTLYSGLP